MNRRQRTNRSVLGLAFALLCAGCTVARHPRVNLRDALALTFTPSASALPDGSTLTVSLRLENPTASPVEACLAEGEGFNILGTAAATGRASIIDHPGCVHRFRIPASMALAWSTTFTLPCVGAGPANINAWVQVVDPWHCDQYGCDAYHIVAPFVPISITQE